MTILRYTTPRSSPVAATSVAVTTVQGGNALGSPGAAHTHGLHSGANVATVAIPANRRIRRIGAATARTFDREPLNTRAGQPQTLHGCTAPPATTIPATVPLWVFTFWKGKDMGRTQTITDRQVDLLLDLEDALGRAFADGVICQQEVSEIAVLVARAKAKAERIHRSQIMAKNVMDNGEVNDNVLRMNREMFRDLAPIVNLADYRNERMMPDTAS